MRRTASFSRRRRCLQRSLPPLLFPQNIKVSGKARLYTQNCILLRLLNTTTTTNNENSNES